MVDTARDNGVRTVFVQPQMSDRAARMLARELGGKVALADPSAQDWAQNLRTVAARLAAASASW